MEWSAHLPLVGGGGVSLVELDKLRRILKTVGFPRNSRFNGPIRCMHYNGMIFGMSDTCLNLCHVSCMFENMSRLSGLCWIDQNMVKEGLCS